MTAICLSPVLGLRCLGLSHIQEAVTLVPVGLEVIFSLGLIFAGRDAGRIRYLLAAEGPARFFLAVLSFLSHVVPVFQNNRVPFEALDIAIGGTSFVPVLLYTTFIYLFNRREFFPRLPKRFTLVAKAFLLAVIPIIVVTNEIASFIGIKYRQNPGMNDYYFLGGPGLTPQQFARVMLSSTSLALLAVVQGLTFLMFVMRLASGLLEQRKIEDRAATGQEGVLFRGVGWLSVGMKLSMCETILGWATPSFGLLFLRNGMRMIGRACIIIGVVRGPERREEFIILDHESGGGFLSGTRKLRVSGLRLRISSPTLIETSMSQRLSRMTLLLPFTRPNPEQGQSTPRRTSIVPWDPSTRTPITGAKSRPPPLMLSRSSEDSHVTVIHRLGRAPTLVLKLPPTGLPSASGNAMAAMNEKLKSGPVSVMVPSPLSGAAPLTAPLPRIRPPPSENHSNTSGRYSGRRSSDFSVLHRRPATSPISSAGDFGVMQSQGPSHSMPSSLRGPHTPHPALAPISPGALQRTSASEEQVHTPRSPVQFEPDRIDSGLSTEWIGSELEDDSRDTYIKTIGTVQPLITPNPTRDLAVHSSIVLERLDDDVEPLAPLPILSIPEQGAHLVRKDSGVLGRDDPGRMRRARRVF